MNHKALLMILDGWGIAPDKKVSAPDNANIPFIDSLFKRYPHAQLRTDGMNVGLPEGQMGNSEVGHMNLGAGRIIYQNLTKINLAVQKHTLQNEKALQEAFGYAKKHNKPVHFLGLLSDGGVHSHTDHLKGLIEAAQTAQVPRMFIHAFTDGRDTDPKSGKGYLAGLLSFIEGKNARLASVIGRYYAMDRDKRWARIKLAYDLLVDGKGEHSRDILASVQERK